MKRIRNKAVFHIMNADKMVSIIRYHGKSNPISCAELARILGVEERRVRDYIRGKRLDKLPIAKFKGTKEKDADADGYVDHAEVEHSHGGYFWAESKEEYQPTIDEMRSIAFAMLDTVKAMDGAFPLEVQTELFRRGSE